MKRYIYGAIIGVFMGLVISLVFSYYASPNHDYFATNPNSDMGAVYYTHFSEVTIMAIMIVIWACIGIVSSIIGKVFAKDEWSLYKATGCHFIILFALLMPLAILAGWFSLTFMAIIKFVMRFIIIYAVIWSMIYTVEHQKIKKINKHLN